MEKKVLPFKFVIRHLSSCFIQYNNYIYISADLNAWLYVYIRLYEIFSDFTPINIYYVQYSSGLFLTKHLYYIIIVEKRFYDRGNLIGRATQIFLETGFDKFTIIQHPQNRFFLCGILKTSEKQNRYINTYAKQKYWTHDYKFLKTMELTCLAWVFLFFFINIDFQKI